MRISGPHVHENLAIYFVHGTSAGGPVPLTLQEALAKGSVQVIETGRVNELQIENTGGEEVFIQAGDIVKGGKQDRVLTVSFLLPPNSGRVPIASFCVEQGRWSARGKEDQAKFSSASEAMPSRRRCWRWRRRRPSRQGCAEPARTRQAGRQRGCQRVSASDEVAEQAAQGLGLGRHHAEASCRSGLNAPRRLAAVGLQPAAGAGEREAEGGARRLHRARCRRPARRTPTSSATSSPSTAR